MAKSPLPTAGSTNPEDLYLCVGVALSYWEAAEDSLMGLFGALCKEDQPIAYASYIKAPRIVRISMLKLALNIKAHLLIKEEIAKTKKSLLDLDKLATTRNEIAHGHVSSFRSEENGLVTADGNYLLPSYNEKGPFERDFRFHHTTGTIAEFTEKVRDARWEIVTTTIEILGRQKSAEHNAGPDSHQQREIARKISAQEISPDQISRYMKPCAEW